MSWTKYTREQVLAAIERAGTVSGVAQLLGCRRQTIYSYMKRWPSVARAFREKQEQVVDAAQIRLWEAVGRGEPWAVLFVLKTLGKHLGYTERVEHEGKVEENIVIRVVYDDKRTEGDT